MFEINLFCEIQNHFLQPGIGFPLQEASGYGKNKSKQQKDNQHQHAGIPESNPLFDGKLFSSGMFSENQFHTSALMTYPAPRTV